jgi:RNA polymerase sigma-70 factor (ECF subfamily)
MLTFHDLYQHYAPEVYRFAFWLAGNRAEAEDITAETFVRAWTSQREIRTETVKAYLLTIARNLYLAQRRKVKPQVALDEEQVDPQPGPEQHTEDRLALAATLAVIQTLPELDRAALILRVQHELPYAEIARVLGLSLSAAKVKVHRARLKVAAQLNEEMI